MSNITSPTGEPTDPDVNGPDDESEDYNAMVLLVDDQVMVAEAIRRSLANQPGVDFHYCIDPSEAIRAPSKSRLSFSRTWSCLGLTA